MPFKAIVRELMEMSSKPRRGSGDGGGGEDPPHAPPPPPPPPPPPRWRCQWEELPPELIQDVIERVEASEAAWPARRDVIACASVCKSWRGITKEVVRTPEECAKITFPISLKQPGPRENPIQCFIKRDRATGTYCLYLGLSPGLQGENGKLLLAAHKFKRTTKTDYVISLSPYNFSRASPFYFGRLRSNFLGTKFSIYDNQPPSDSAISSNIRLTQMLHSRQVSPRAPVGNYHVATISYELNVLRQRGQEK